MATELNPATFIDWPTSATTKSPLVLVQFCGPDQARRINAIARENVGRLSPLQFGSAVRRLAEVAPFRCPCGCGRIIEHEPLVRDIERKATLS